MPDYPRYFLIADDDPDDQFLIGEVIRSIAPEDIGTRFVNNGMELTDFLDLLNGTASRPGLMIMDLNMPRKDGRQALGEIKANPDLASIPIVILTTSQSEEDMHYCRKLGVAGYYRKPSSIAELRDIIAKLYMDFFQQG
jgi:CheY-like chemotaxis protein